ncbi:MAG: ABC transporter ATP-binding protein [Pseudomonadota bacterium]
MIEIKNLCKQFGPFIAVDNISFSVSRGEVLGFLGPNGAGKSTTMKMITGFLAPTSGTAVIDGHDIIQAPLEVKKRIGYLPEGAPAYPDMTPLEFLGFIAEVRGFKGAERDKRVLETVERVNLGGVIHQNIETLSKGFKRRVGLAQAILHDPEVLVMDEPTDGLDPNQKHEVRNLIQEMSSEKVIILSTHILEEVDAVCSRAIVIASGKVVADGTPAELEARADNHNSVRLTLKANGHSADDIRQGLLKLGSVEKLDVLVQDSDHLSYQLYPAGEQAIVAEVSQQAREQQWEVTELHVQQGRLDEVFRSITSSGVN